MALLTQHYFISSNIQWTSNEVAKILKKNSKVQISSTNDLHKDVTKKR